MLRGFDEHDRRAERFWELVAIIRAAEQPPTVHQWIEQALRAQNPANSSRPAGRPRETG
jgi:hypothetical protein